MKQRLWFYSFLLLIFAVFSYSLTAPNLVLSTWKPYWQFQTWMWTTFFNNRQVLTLAFVVLGLAIWLIYFWILPQLKKVQPKAWLLALAVAPLLLANNALSHDVFNYIFNARMVIQYQANPHRQVALNFAQDPWVRFMHNTHTPAPYFYGWTLLSLLPYGLSLIISGAKFLPTWFLFRGFSFISWLSLMATLAWFIKRKQQRFDWWYYALCLSPLLLIEVIANAHNDLWMMMPAMWSIFLLITTNTARSNRIRPRLKKALSLILLLVSASIKLASVALIPLWLILAWDFNWLKWSWAQKLMTWVRKNWAFSGSVLLFLPLLTPRSKLFLPWYLSWSLVWLPLIKKRWHWWKSGLLVLSISSFWRYLPFLWHGNYEEAVAQSQQLITWLPLLGFLLSYLVSQLMHLKKVASRNKSTGLK